MFKLLKLAMTLTEPVIEGGELTLNMPDLSTKTVQLQRIQLEIVRLKIESN